MKQIIIIHGPPASGKTINSESLRKHYKCDHVFDQGFDNAKILAAQGRVLVLSPVSYPKGPKGNRKLFHGAVSIPVAEAAFALGGKWNK